MNKKGIMKIIEATTAILIVASVLFINYNSGIVENKPDYSENARDILEELANDVGLRDEVLDYEENETIPQSITAFIEERKPVYLSSSARICDVGDVCGLSDFVGDVFSAERIISSNLDIYNPKKVRLFLWEKG